MDFLCFLTDQKMCIGNDTWERYHFSCLYNNFQTGQLFSWFVLGIRVTLLCTVHCFADINSYCFIIFTAFHGVNSLAVLHYYYLWIQQLHGLFFHQRIEIKIDGDWEDCNTETWMHCKWKRSICMPNLIFFLWRTRSFWWHWLCIHLCYLYCKMFFIPFTAAISIIYILPLGLRLACSSVHQLSLQSILYAVGCLTK